MISYRVGILTVSDRCFSGENVDRSGPILLERVHEFGFVVVETAVVPDEINAIQSKLTEWSNKCDLILTTGGTGLSSRDITPTATRPLLTRESSGISEFIRARGYLNNPRAALSCGIAGLINRCLIVNLPGSLKGGSEGWECLELLLPHALDIASDSQADH